MPSSVPLSILDLGPVPAGGTAADALRNTIDLARVAEAAGYRRYWVAEHHLNPGVARRRPPSSPGSWRARRPRSVSARARCRCR